MNGKMEVSGREAEGLPGVVGDGEELIEAGGKSLEKGGIGCGGDGSVDPGEGDSAFSID